MSSEEVLSTSDQRNREKEAQTAGLIQKSASEKTVVPDEDPTADLKMAGARQSHGTKRHLSMSPSKDFWDCTIDKNYLETPASITTGHISKKRVLSTQENEKNEDADGLTGNDPGKGQAQTGNHPDPELLRTKSKMATPMVVNNDKDSPTTSKAYGHITNVSDGTKGQEVENIIAITCNSTPNETDEETLLKNRFADETNGNIDTSVPNQLTVSSSSEAKTAHPTLTTTMEDKKRGGKQEELIATNIATEEKETPNVAVPSGISNSNTLPSSSPPAPRHSPHPSPLNRRKPGLRKPSKPSPSPSTRLRSQLRNKTGRNKTDFKLHKSCIDCTNCKACEQFAKKPVDKNKATNVTAPKKTTRGRGRPRKQATEKEKGKEQVPKDIQSLFLDIKDDISDVNVQINDIKKQQVNNRDELCNLLDSKLNDVKQTVGLDLSGIKEKVNQNESLLNRMQTTQTQFQGKMSVLEGLEKDVSSNSKSISDMSNEQNLMGKNVEDINVKLVSVQDKTCDIELSIIKQNRAHEQTNWEISGHIQDVEYGLAAHVETVKSNMEKELVGAKQNQILLENKLANFTDELDQQNSQLNEKIKELRNDFEQLKTVYVDTFESTTPNTHSASNSFSNLSSQSDYSNTPRSTFSMDSGNSQNSCDPENEFHNDPEDFYMYGDTTKTLIIDGLKETRHENLGEIIFQCITEIGFPLDPSDIIEVIRIGRFSSNRKWPRPVKVTFRDQTKRDQTFIFKSRLRFSESFKDARINKEQRKDIRIKAAKLRQAGMTARKMGCKVESIPGQVTIDGIEYNTLTLNSIPSIYMQEANKTRNKPQNNRREALLDKTKTNPSKVIMVGPSLQKTPYGLAFYSVSSFLSNFYPCQIHFRNQCYISLEQGYQCSKAEICEDREAYHAILKAKTPSQMKSIGKEIQTNDHWEEIKLRVMEDLVYAKFKQNEKLYYSLMNTRPLNLIEATLDEFWGANCVLGSIALEEGSWKGLNHLGEILMKIRAHFAKELEIEQGALC